MFVATDTSAACTPCVCRRATPPHVKRSTGAVEEVKISSGRQRVSDMDILDTTPLDTTSVGEPLSAGGWLLDASVGTLLPGDLSMCSYVGEPPPLVLALGA